MDKIARGFIALALALTCAVPAFATDHDTFNKLLAKYATDDTKLFTSPFKPKAACECMAAQASQAPGFVNLDPLANRLYCALPIFDSNGKFVGVDYYCPQFQVLAK